MYLEVLRWSLTYRGGLLTPGETYKLKDADYFA